MLELKDPAIKLFGKTIPVLEVSVGALAQPSGGTSVIDQDGSSTSSISSADGNIVRRDTEEQEENNKESSNHSLDPLDKKPTETNLEDRCFPLSSEEFTNSDTSASLPEVPKSPSAEKETIALKSDEGSETSNSQEKTLKKPDKILPCPRCNSMDTKFCYYNNYNVNQPRHFCRNCQRYWTAGGTMRNVPVGAGRRKNKNSSSHHHQIITVPESIQTAQSDLPNGIIHHPNPNGMVLTFGSSDTPLYESIASVLNLADKSMGNGYHKLEEIRVPINYPPRDQNEDHSNGCPDEAGKLPPGSQDQVMRNCPGFIQPQVPFFPGAPWPYPWNTGQWISPVPPPPFCPPGFPMPCYPSPAYWGCTIPAPWNIPWVPRPSCNPNHTAVQSSDASSPTLGKHSRDENVINIPSTSGEEEEKVKECNGERCLWIPKTLRIDDPGEAARSSIWATLGIKNDQKGDMVSGGGGLFKAFHSKGDEKSHTVEPSPALQVNPAAFSRSINFHESS